MIFFGSTERFLIDGHYRLKSGVKISIRLPMKNCRRIEDIQRGKYYVFGDFTWFESLSEDFKFLDHGIGPLGTRNGT